MDSTMADKVDENMATTAVPVQKDNHTMDSTMTNDIEDSIDEDATPTLKEKPLFHVSSFEPSARLTKLLNEIVAQKPIKKLEDHTPPLRHIASTCPTPACSTSGFSQFIPAPPTPEVYNNTVDVAMQDDTNCPTPYSGPGLTFDSLESTPVSEVLSDHLKVPALINHEVSTDPSAESPITETITNVAKQNVQDTLFSTSVAANEKIAPHLDATNQYIVHLRDETHYGWAHIAAMLNSQPVTHPLPESGTSGTSGTSATPFNPSAVYSRYIRTKYHLRAAADAAETLARRQAKVTKRKRSAARRDSTAAVDSDDSDFSAGEKVSQPPKAVAVTVPKGPVVWEEHMDKLLKVAVKEVQGEFWEGVAKRVVEKKGSAVQPSECAKRFMEVDR
ncbi:hypothetical protein MMC18_007944 [Xylographa bjoerkii]|nr:hypothetical protein [Xylographa bjoerkii]